MTECKQPKPVHVDELIRVLESGKHGSWGHRAAETVRMLAWGAAEWVAIADAVKKDQGQ